MMIMCSKFDPHKIAYFHGHLPNTDNLPVPK